MLGRRALPAGRIGTLDASSYFADSTLAARESPTDAGVCQTATVRGDVPEAHSYTATLPLALMTRDDGLVPEIA
jgi:hypothetical protein